jgi:hypothetical protein
MIAVIAAEIDRLQKMKLMNLWVLQKAGSSFNWMKNYWLSRTLQHDWISYVLSTVKFYFDIFKGLISLNFELKCLEWDKFKLQGKCAVSFNAYKFILV